MGDSPVLTKRSSAVVLRGMPLSYQGTGGDRGLHHSRGVYGVVLCFMGASWRGWAPTMASSIDRFRRNE